MYQTHTRWLDLSVLQRQTNTGAPEIILGKCDAILIKGRPRPLNDIYKRAYKDAYKEVAAQGERVLGELS